MAEGTLTTRIQRKRAGECHHARKSERVQIMGNTQGYLRSRELMTFASRHYFTEETVTLWGWPGLIWTEVATAADEYTGLPLPSEPVARA